jgi:type VII secretion integral membrane protein EccD
MTEGLTLANSHDNGWSGETPASSASGGAASPLVRVAVLGDGKLADLALPTDLPLREIIPAVRRLVAPASAEETTPDGRRLSLAPLGGAPFSLDATLAAVGIVDGDLLALQPLPAGPAATSVVEDVADAAALAGSRIGPGWNAGLTQRVARVTAAAFLLLLTAIASAWWSCGGGGVPARCALVGVAVAAVAASLAFRSRNAQEASAVPSAAVLLPVVALFPVTAAAAALVPGAFGPAQVLLAAAAATTWAVLCLLGSEHSTAFFTAVAAFGLASGLVSGAQVLWHVSSPASPCLLILFALALTVAAPALSVLFARLPLPDLPAPGDPLPTPNDDRVLADLPRRASRAASLHTGLVAGATSALVLGVLCLLPTAAGGAGAGNFWRWYVALAALSATVLRARVPAGAAAKAWLVAAPALVAALGAGIAARAGEWLWSLVLVGVLGAIAAVWLVVAARPKLADPEGYSLPARRVVNLFALALDASLIPVIAYLCGVFQWVLAG